MVFPMGSGITMEILLERSRSRRSTEPARVAPAGGGASRGNWQLLRAQELEKNGKECLKCPKIRRPIPDSSSSTSRCRGLAVELLEYLSRRETSYHGTVFNRELSFKRFNCVLTTSFCTCNWFPAATKSRQFKVSAPLRV